MDGGNAGPATHAHNYYYITTGICFLISIFFALICASIPLWATGCALVLVGCLMMRQVTSVNRAFIGDALPAFVTIIAMPFTYSEVYGLIAGLFIYTVLNGLIYITKKDTGGRIQPLDADAAEYRTYKPGGGTPPWFIRASQGRWWKTGVFEEVGADGREIQEKTEDGSE
jgi:AGZA family xanthine/uracil permease-like MFS transporter